MTNTKSEKELVFEVGAEGGSIEIYRANDKIHGRFTYMLKVNEYDFAEDVAVHHGSYVSDNFYTIHFIMEEKYPWYHLYPVFVHEDFREDIADFLIEKLNKKVISYENFNIHKKDWERVLLKKFTLDYRKLDVDYQKIWLEEIIRDVNYSYSRYGDNYELTLIENKRSNYQYKLLPYDENFPDFESGYLGTVKVKYNSLLIFDKSGNLSYVLPANKYVVTLAPVMSRLKQWKWFDV